MSTRTKAVAYVHPTGRRPYKDPARLDYRDNAELKAQLTLYVRSKWITSDRIDIDLGTRQILIGGHIVAGFAITEPRPTTAQEGLPL